MAFNTQYQTSWTSGTGWRFVLTVRPAPGNDVTSYTTYDLPYEAVRVLQISCKYPKKPLGMPDALTMSVRIDLTALTGDSELEYLRDRLIESCVIAGDTVWYNSFILTSDCGNGFLAESQFYALAVCVQKPDLQRQTALDDPDISFDLELIDALKVSAEVMAITDPISDLGGSSPQVGTITGGWRPAEWWLAHYKRIYHRQGSSFEYRGLLDGMRTAVYRVCAKAYYAMRNRTIGYSDFTTFASTIKMDPYHEGWQFYSYTGSTDLNAKAALDRADVKYCIRVYEPDGQLTGYESGNSRYSPSKRADNWWNWLQLLSESAFAKGAIRWINPGTSSPNPFPVIVFDRPFGDFGELVQPIDHTFIHEGATLTTGHEVIKSAAVLAFERNTQQDGVSETDVTEWVHGSKLSIASDEWGVKEVLFDNLPEARGHDSTEGAIRRQNRIWLNLLYRISGGQPERIHHHVKLNDGVLDTEGPASVAVSLNVLNSATQHSIQMLKLQTEHGGLPGTLAKAIYNAFGRRNQSRLECSLDWNERWFPHNIGRKFELEYPTELNTMYANIFDEPAILVESTVDFESETVKCAFFLRGSRGPL